MTFVKRLLIFAILWWILAEGSLQAPFVSGLIVIAATLASFVVLPATAARWRPLALFPLAGFFVVQSLQGGLDVARRAFTPSLPIRPALIDIALDLPDGFPVVLYAWLVSLTPGSASVHIEGPALTVHVLDDRLPVEQTLRELERRVRALFVSPDRLALR
jgi:multicomponent Na+:H+ antiporter subunit E